MFIAALQAIAVLGAYSAGKRAVESERAKEEADAAAKANANSDSIRALSDAELDERLRKFTRK